MLHLCTNTYTEFINKRKHPFCQCILLFPNGKHYKNNIELNKVGIIIYIVDIHYSFVSKTFLSFHSYVHGLVQGHGLA